MTVTSKKDGPVCPGARYPSDDDYTANCMRFYATRGMSPIRKLPLILELLNMTFHTSPCPQQKCSSPCCALHSTVMTKMHVSNLSLFFCDLVPRSLGQHPSNIFGSTCLRTAALKTSSWVKTLNCGSPLNSLCWPSQGWWWLVAASISPSFPVGPTPRGHC